MSYYIQKYRFKVDENCPLEVLQENLESFAEEYGWDFPEINPFEELLKQLPSERPLKIAKFSWGGMGSGNLELVETFLTYCDGNCSIEFVGEDGSPCGIIELKNGKVIRTQGE